MSDNWSPEMEAELRARIGTPGPSPMLCDFCSDPSIAQSEDANEPEKFKYLNRIYHSKREHTPMASKEAHNPDEKYIVFKRSEFDLVFRRSDRNELEAIALPDAVVIRTQDIFAGPALHVYASSMAITVATRTNWSLADENLQSIADYFYERANEADEARANGAAKLPD